MSSNAVSNQPTNEFFARAKELLQEKFNIGKEVESSSTKSKKLTNEGKETYKASIEESIGEVNIGSIQEKDADSGLLRSKVFTLDNTASDEIAKMSKALTLTLELINKSGGAEKTFMAQNSADALKDRVLELALKISDTKNEDDDPARASLKSLAATVVEKSFPKLLDNGKTGLTQDETQSIKMMLFSNNDAAAFAGAVKLLQSVKSYEEVAPDAVKEKTLSDGTTGLKVNPDSVYKKILKAVGSGSVGTHITEILKATVDKALHGRLTKDEQDILKTDPSLKNAYDTVHRDLISKIEQRSRDNIIQPLKEDLKSVSQDVLVNKYFGDSELSENKILSLVKKTVQGIINMVRPSGNEFSKRAFGAGSFYDSSLKLNTLADKVDTDIRHLTNLENRVGMTQDRLATDSSTKLDIPLDVIARKDNEGADTVAKLIKFIAGDVEKHAEYDPEALKKWQESFKAVVAAPNKIADIQSQVANSAVQAQIAALGNNKETSIGGLLITKLKDDTNDTLSVQVKLGSDTVTTNAEGASKVIESYNQRLEAQRKSEEGFQIAGNLAKAYLAVDPNANQGGKTLKDQLVNIKDNLSGADNVQKFTSALKQDSDLITYNFGLESSRKTDEESILKSLAKLAPETREDLVSVKSTIEEATSKATKLIKDESKAVPHLAITTGQAIRDGLLSSDGETFKVSSALGQHLFDSVQQSVGKEAGAAYNKLLDQKFARVNDIGKADAELTGNTNSLVIKSIADNNYHGAIVALNSELQSKDVTDKDAKAFIESFKNSNQDLLNASNYKGEVTEDKARFNLLMSKLIDSALELKDDNKGYTTILNNAKVNTFINTNLDSITDADRSSMNKKAAVLSEVLDSMPDTKEMDILSKISRGTVRSFQSLENLKSSEWQRKIVDKMVTGFLEMARTGAVKLDSIKEVISGSDNSSNAMENLLKTTLVSRLQSAAV
jgi:hypothetical protein